MWLTARGPVPVHQPILIGILNVTPDSFSDGGRYGAVARALDAALAHTDALLAAGAHVIDVGGESTRPGRVETVAALEERQRVVPTIEAIVRAHPDVLVSVDTVKAEVAAAALDAGAAIVNDVTAFRHDPRMAATVAAAHAGVVLMHSRGALLDIASYKHAEYDDAVVVHVAEELGVALDASVAAGVALESIVLDPGFGFGKTVEQNYQLLDQLAVLQRLGRPLLVGPSRKRFLGAVADLPVDRRDRVTAVACALAYERGARLFRVHDVEAAREALALVQAVHGGS